MLSACNTAAADGSPGAEGSLASRAPSSSLRLVPASCGFAMESLLSVAAVRLTTGIFRARDTRGCRATRAAALRASILALLAEDQLDYLESSDFWASFQLAGEGAREGSPAVSEA